ncbi:WG repeat-containing protein [Paractinoplanes brasiliensis]|uniref:WG repeat-containing protein n=1 Tax=Paractinoplanes brasiliensis TaxID=52695 RepID=UPI0019450844|nr:WG repeat-containing protein [Actinoplanes brasiliensis]
MEPEGRFEADAAEGDGEPFDAEIVEPEIDDDEPAVLRAAQMAGNDDIVDAELVEDAPDSVAVRETTRAISAEAHSGEVTERVHAADDASRNGGPEDVEAGADQPDDVATPVTEPGNTGTPIDQADNTTTRADEADEDNTTTRADEADEDITPAGETDKGSAPDADVSEDSTPAEDTRSGVDPDVDATRAEDTAPAEDTGQDTAPAEDAGQDNPAAEDTSTDSPTSDNAGENTEPAEDTSRHDSATDAGTDATEAGVDAAPAGQVSQDVPAAQEASEGAKEDEDGEREDAGAQAPAYARKPIRQRREQVADPRNRRTDPEQILAAYPVTYDPLTLREQIEDDEPMWVVIDRLTDKLEYAERDADRARLLSLRAVASRLLNDLGPALEDATAALAHAEATGDLVRVATVKARLGHVLLWRGEHAEADRVFEEADSAELPARLRAEVQELAGRSAFEQGRYLEAVNHLELALDLRKGADPDLVERIELALDTITARAAKGWGPYPRTRDEIVGKPAQARPLRDDASGLWGYPGLLTPQFAQAQPFADGVAWVRRPEAQAWELIDAAGRLLVDASAGYRAAGRFSDGLAWVSRDDAGGWYAIDKQNRVIVPGGFDDARPFHNGLALVRRGGWGVVDRHARPVVLPQFRAFATMLASGEPVDGFTEEGLAVVDAGEVYGVVDRAGQLLVQPVHAALLIHPSAFLVADRFGLWGALDRRGEPLVELKYRERADVLDEIDKLIKDTRPVL